jgi:hypothetical protein
MDFTWGARATRGVACDGSESAAEPVMTTLSPKTIKLYLAALSGLTAYLRAQGMPLEPEGIRREHLEAFVLSRLETVKASTVDMEYRHL